MRSRPVGEVNEHTLREFIDIALRCPTNDHILELQIVMTQSMVVQDFQALADLHSGSNH